MTRFHFDLRHVADPAGLVAEVHGATFELVAQTSDTLTAEAAAHPVLAAMPAERTAAFSHYADIADDCLDGGSEAVRWVRVVRPAAPGVHLPEVILVAQYLPAHHLHAYARRAMARDRLPPTGSPADPRRQAANAPRLYAGKLAHLEVAGPPADAERLGELLVQAQTLVTPYDTAADLASHHPELATTEAYAKTIIRNDHIWPDKEIDPDQYNAVQALGDAIGKPSGQPWSPVVACKDHNGQPLKAGYALDTIAEGQQLYTNGLREDVHSLATPVIQGARRTASDDLQLATKTWSPTPGTATLVGDAAVRTPRTAVAATAPAFKWTLSEPTDSHGLWVHPDSISISADGVLSVDASQTFLRTLYAGYRLLNDAGQPLGGTTKLGSVSAADTIMGIPCPTDPTTLQIPLGSASGVELRFGSFGTSNWDQDVSPSGALLTGLWQYGIPAIFLVAGKALESTSLFNKIVNDRQLTAATLAIAFPIVGGGLATATAVANTSSYLIAFGDAVICMVLQKGLEKLGTWLTEQAAEGAIASAFGPVGWVMRLAAAGLDFEEMAVTTGEWLSSPACIPVTITRAIDVSLTLHPDPRHGEAGHPETAVWPAVAARYEVTVQLQNGTPHKLPGQLPAGTAPVDLVFQDVPAGGKLRVLAAVYSDSGWLAGAWQSDWIDATPTEGTTLELGDQHITETLVPLAGDTQYVFKERVTITDGKYAWAAGAPPAATRTGLDCAGTGTLCELAGLSINNSAFQVGYAWRASGQGLHPDRADAPPSGAQLYAVQNLSVLADPDARLITTPIGFTNRPVVAYAASTNPSDHIDQTNFVIDPRDGGMNLRQVVLDGKPDFGFGDPLPSWGSFPLEAVDAAAVHPSNIVLACSWQAHKLMLLPLPQVPAPDGQAPVALMVSGKGLRQGLVEGPVALAVAPDGRILVLESLNRRVQAFDIKGNPVPCFTPGPAIATVPTATIAGDLDACRVPESLQTALQAAGEGYQGSLPASLASALDSGRFTSGDALLQQFAELGVALAYDKDAMSDPAQSAQITVVQAGSSWRITDPRGWQWQVTAASDGLDVFARLTAVDIQPQRTGAQWLVVDRRYGNAWRLTPSPGTPGSTEVRQARSYFGLRGAPAGPATYVDLAVEPQGYLYVLSYQNDGGAPADYLLDIYAPDGTFTSRTPDPARTAHPQNVVAGRIAVDLFRNLYGLTYDPLRGPHGGPQPGLAHWTPTPPLFSIPDAAAHQPDFADRNIAAVTNDFQQYGELTLTSAAFVSVDNPDGAWTVRDGTSVYHIYRTGDQLQVYTKPA